MKEFTSAVQNKCPALVGDWQQLRRLLSLALSTMDQGQTIRQLAAKIDRLTTTTDQAQSRPQPSYATVAKLTAPPAPEVHSTIVRIESEEGRAHIASNSNGQILQALQRDTEKYPAAGKIIATQKLPSGDLRVLFADRESKEALDRAEIWKENLQGKTLRTLYPVLVHGLRVDKPETLIPLLVEANKALHPGLQIAKANWLLTPKRLQEKTHSSLIIHINSADVANNAIQKGILLNHILHTAVLHSPKFSLTQCFKCQRYGHTAPNCKAPGACGKCAKDHPTAPCTTTVPKCANCNGRHTSWNPACKIREANKAKIEAAKAMAPLFHQTQSQQRSPPPAPDTNQWTEVRRRGCTPPPPAIPYPVARKSIAATRRSARIGRLTDRATESREQQREHEMRDQQEEHDAGLQHEQETEPSLPLETPQQIRHTFS